MFDSKYQQLKNYVCHQLYIRIRILIYNVYFRGIDVIRDLSLDSDEIQPLKSLQVVSRVRNEIKFHKKRNNYILRHNRQITFFNSQKHYL